MKVKIVFAGTSDVAIPTLEKLLQAGHEVDLVVTRMDAPRGRKKILTQSEVAEAATKHKLHTLKINSFDSHSIDLIVNSHADLGVVVSYGGLIPQSILKVPRLGWINLHFSSLPELRGAAPVQWAIREGRTHISTTVFQLVEELDAGDIYSVEEHFIAPSLTAGEALDYLATEGAKQVIKVVESMETSTPIPIPQHGNPTYARKLLLEDGHLHTNTSAQDLHNIYRSVTPEPGAWVYVDGERLKILSANLSTESGKQGTISQINNKTYLFSVEGSLELVYVQPSGKQKMAAADWWRGLRVEEISFE